MPSPKDPAALEAYRKKMSEIAKAKGYGKWMEGKKHAPEAIEKMRQVQAERGNDPAERKRRSERARTLGYGKWMTGRKLPRDVVAKMRTGTMKAKKLTEDTGATQVAHFMSKHHNRKHFAENPRSKDPDIREKHNSDWRYKEWRTAVFQRDDYTCQVCQKRGGSLHAHHVKGWAKFPELRYVVGNGLTVCEDPCHKTLHAAGTRA